MSTLEARKLMNTQLLVTIPETMLILRASRTGVYNAMDRGELESVKIGRRRMVTVASIRKLMSQDQRSAS